MGEGAWLGAAGKQASVRDATASLHLPLGLLACAPGTPRQGAGRGVTPYAIYTPKKSRQANPSTVGVLAVQPWRPTRRRRSEQPKGTPRSKPAGARQPKPQRGGGWRAHRCLSSAASSRHLSCGSAGRAAQTVAVAKTRAAADSIAAVGGTKTALSSAFRSGRAGRVCSFATVNIPPAWTQPSCHTSTSSVYGLGSTPRAAS